MKVKITCQCGFANEIEDAQLTEDYESITCVCCDEVISNQAIAQSLSRELAQRSGLTL